MTAMRDREKMLEINRRIGKQKIGKENPPGPSAKGPDHWKSRYWKIKGPNGVILEGWNLNEIIRQNADLFASGDVIWRKSKCRAAKGIRDLFQPGKDGVTKVHEWKGWTALVKADVEPHGAACE
jgi:hypothetical protein